MVGCLLLASSGGVKYAHKRTCSMIWLRYNNVQTNLTLPSGQGNHEKHAVVGSQRHPQLQHRASRGHAPGGVRVESVE